MPGSVKVFNTFPNNVFVETGSNKGDGIQHALNAGFPLIKSVELNHKIYEKCVERFKDKDNVILFEGSSGDLLWDMIKDIETPITFWLDAHKSLKSPFIKELNVIKRHPIKTHSILIDDVRCMSGPLF